LAAPKATEVVPTHLPWKEDGAGASCAKAAVAAETKRIDRSIFGVRRGSRKIGGAVAGRRSAVNNAVGDDNALNGK